MSLLVPWHLCTHREYLAKERGKEPEKETKGIAQATSLAPSPLLFLLPFLGHPPAHTHLSLSLSLSLSFTQI